jgi:hypothetical protein
MAGFERTVGTHYVVRLIPPRPTFDRDMDDREREIMGRHAAYYAELAQAGKIVSTGRSARAAAPGAWA